MSNADYNPGLVGQDSFARSANAYPFVSETPVQAVVEDLVVSSFETPVLDLWLTWVAGLGTAATDPNVPAKVHAVDLLLQDENTTLLFDTRDFEEFELVEWDNNRWIATWTSDTTTITLVYNDRDNPKAGYRLTRALLDPRTQHWQARPLTDLKVWTGEEYVSALRSDGEIRFREGFNALVATEPAVSDRGETVQDLNIDFVGGEGQGRYPACDHNLGVRKLGEAVPNSVGDLVIHGDSCIDIRPVLVYGTGSVAVSIGEFTLADGCSAPCECVDFTNLYAYIRKVGQLVGCPRCRRNWCSSRWQREAKLVL